MKCSLIVTTLAALAAPAFAQPIVAIPIPPGYVAGPTTVGQGPLLWGDIKVGATLTEVRQRYPGGKFERDTAELTETSITPDCGARVRARFRGDVIESVELRGFGSIGGRCSSTVMAALGAKYGQPSTRGNTKFSIVADEGETAVWTRDGVMLQFKRYTSGVMGGGGLAKPSWRLTYTPIDAVLNL